MFRAGAAVNRALDILARNFLGFWLVAGLVTLPNVLIEITSGDDFLWMILAAIISGILVYLSQAMLADAAFQGLGGEAVDMSRSVQTALSRFFPLIGLTGWVGLAVGFGFVLLVVPGLIFLVMFSVAVPVCVVEERRAIASMRRSADLTAGYRWPLFGLYVVMALIVWMAMLIVHRVLAEIGGDPVEIVGSWAARAAVTAFHAVLGVVVYHDLRAAKESADASPSLRFPRR